MRIYSRCRRAAFGTNLSERNIMTTKTSSRSTPASPMTTTAAARIQGSTAKSNGGAVAKGSFAARAQSAAAKGGKR